MNDSEHVSIKGRSLRWDVHHSFMMDLVDVESGDRYARVLFREPGAYRASVEDDSKWCETEEEAQAWCVAKLEGSS